MSWLRAYTLMLRFEVASARTTLPFLVGIQVLLGLGAAFMYGNYIPHLSSQAALYLVTGAPTLAVFPVGTVVLPSLIGAQKTARTFEFVWTLPVPRAAGVAATLTVFTLVAVPGIVATLLIATVCYGVQLTVSPAIVPALLLTTLMSASIGVGLAHGIADPIVANLVATVLMFTAMMFAPIAIPIDNFPAWLADLHRVLPFYHAAVIVRSALSTGLTHEVVLSYGMVAAWTVAGWALAARVIGRRG